MDSFYVNIRNIAKTTYPISDDKFSVENKYCQ